MWNYLKFIINEPKTHKMVSLEPSKIKTTLRYKEDESIKTYGTRSWLRRSRGETLVRGEILNHIPDGSGVYIIIFNDNEYYVGQTVNLRSRLATGHFVPIFNLIDYDEEEKGWYKFARKYITNKKYTIEIITFEVDKEHLNYMESRLFYAALGKWNSFNLNQTGRDARKKLEVSEDYNQELKQFAEETGLDFVLTPFADLAARKEALDKFLEEKKPKSKKSNGEYENKKNFNLAMGTLKMMISMYKVDDEPEFDDFSTESVAAHRAWEEREKKRNKDYKSKWTTKR